VTILQQWDTWATVTTLLQQCDIIAPGEQSVNIRSVVIM
jgi:hypothetical protein